MKSKKPMKSGMKMKEKAINKVKSMKGKGKLYDDGKDKDIKKDVKKMKSRAKE